MLDINLMNYQIDFRFKLLIVLKIEKKNSEFRVNLSSSQYYLPFIREQRLSKIVC